MQVVQENKKYILFKLCFIYIPYNGGEKYARQSSLFSSPIRTNTYKPINVHKKCMVQLLYIVQVALGRNIHVIWLPTGYNLHDEKENFMVNANYYYSDRPAAFQNEKRTNGCKKKT